MLLLYFDYLRESYTTLSFRCCSFCRWLDTDTGHRRLHYAMPRPLAGSQPHKANTDACKHLCELARLQHLAHRHQRLHCLAHAAGWAPWTPPELTLPPWCDNVSDNHGNRAFTLLPQHPCSFLRNTTAAALAAEGRVK